MDELNCSIIKKYDEKFLKIIHNFYEKQFINIQVTNYQ